MSNTTKVIGYYNGNKWPIQLVISKLNVTLVLQSNEFILDRATGSKINDPYFDVYVQNKQLMREEGDKELPIVAIPVVTPNTPARDGNAVRSITNFKEVRGVRTPVMETARPTEPQPLPHRASHMGMSVEEARKLGFIRKTRDVPEDYGTPDSPDSPPRNIPPIRYATDTTRTKPSELPKELTEAIASEAAAAPLVQQLVKAAAAAPVVETPFANTTIPATAAASPLAAGRPNVPAVKKVVKAAPPAPVEEEEEVQPDEDALPTPHLEGTNMLGVAEPEVDEEPVAEPVEEAPSAAATLVEEALQEEEKPLPQPLPRGRRTAQPLTPQNKFICLACGTGFPFRSKLEQHAHQSHPQSVVQILSQYPKV